MNNEPRTADRLRAHYEVERTLADELRGAGPAERTNLYGTLYTKLFASLPDHPQHRADTEKRQVGVRTQINMLRSYFGPTSTFVEIGCGDAAVAKGVAGFVNESVGVDVTPVLVGDDAPANFRFVQTEGVKLDLPSASADMIYSNQLMEHLHPDDAAQQLREICRVLKRGGTYLCITPNRITGPHDISVYFGREPVGFHMREYDHSSLAAMFRQAGFSSAKARIALKGVAFTLPARLVGAIERPLHRVARAAGLDLAHYGPLRSLAGVVMVGQKS